jgi:hypothetical protein
MNFTVNLSYLDIYLVPNYSFRYKSHELEIGPSFRHTDYQRGNFKFTGFSFGYYYYPNGFGEKFDFYVCSDFKYDRTGVRDILGSDLMFTSPTEFRAILFRWNLGYGFKYVFLKRFYFATDVGVGRVYQKSYTEFVSKETMLNHERSLQTRVKLGMYF